MDVVPIPRHPRRIGTTEENQPSTWTREAPMKTIRTIAFILFLCATAFGVMLTLHYLPIPEILPSEITSWVPARWSWRRMRSKEARESGMVTHAAPVSRAPMPT